MVVKVIFNIPLTRNNYKQFPFTNRLVLRGNIYRMINYKSTYKKMFQLLNNSVTKKTLCGTFLRNIPKRLVSVSARPCSN